MRSCLINNHAQSAIEFSLAFILVILFLILTGNLFVWLNHNLVQRQSKYEATRVQAASPSSPGKLDFYKTPELNVFAPGGIGEK
jgi:uncharacterized protein (UPF0333 family)